MLKLTALMGKVFNVSILEGLELDKYQDNIKKKERARKNILNNLG